MIRYNMVVEDYQELVSKVVDRALELNKDLVKTVNFYIAKDKPLEDSVHDLFDPAIRECITDYRDKWTII